MSINLKTKAIPRSTIATIGSAFNAYTAIRPARAIAATNVNIPIPTILNIINVCNSFFFGINLPTSNRVPKIIVNVNPKIGATTAATINNGVANINHFAKLNIDLPTPSSSLIPLVIASILASIISGSSKFFRASASTLSPFPIAAIFLPPTPISPSKAPFALPALPFPETLVFFSICLSVVSI